MNVEAWRSQQKALKDEERKRQKDAALALQSYRGGVSEEDTKLSALREEERKKKLEAEQRMREYRGNLSEEEKKLAAMKEADRRLKQEAERSIQNWGDTSYANMSSSNGMQAPPPSRPEIIAPSGEPQEDPLHSIKSGSVSEMAGKFSFEGNGSINLDAGKTAPAMTSNMESPSVEQPGTNGDTNVSTASHADMNGTAFQGATDISPSSSDLPPTMNGMNEFHAPPTVNNMNVSKDNTTMLVADVMNGHDTGPGIEKDLAMPTTNTMNGETGELLTATTPATLTTLSADFYFGLITESQTPNNLDEYIGSVHTVLQTVMANNPITASEVQFDTPTVKEVTQDAMYTDPAGRSNVHRHMVHVSIPIRTTNAVIGHDVKDKVIAGVCAAIQDGSFKL